MVTSKKRKVPERLITEAEAFRDSLNRAFENQGIKREVTRNSVLEAGADIFKDMRMQVIGLQNPVGPRKVTRIVTEFKTRKVKRR